MGKCCCCQLRTAAIIVALWDIAAGILLLVLTILLYLLQSSVKMVRDSRVKNDEENTQWIVEPDVENSIAYLEEIEIPFWTKGNINSIAYGLLLVILGSILMHGIRNKLEKILLIWIALSALLVAIDIMLKIFTGFSAIGAVEIIFLALQMLFIKVVYDHRKEIQDQNTALPSVVKPFIRD